MMVSFDEVPHVGVGEVFVVAGQSNSANHGEEKQRTQTGLVATFDGNRWQLAHDPQPGVSGGGGSFLPPFGDAIAERFKVPVGLVACGIGATSVREWLPKGARFPHPPTLLGRVQQLPSGEWESKGEAFAMFTARLKRLGPRGSSSPRSRDRSPPRAIRSPRDRAVRPAGRTRHRPQNMGLSRRHGSSLDVPN